MYFVASGHYIEMKLTDTRPGSRGILAVPYMQYNHTCVSLFYWFTGTSPVTLIVKVLTENQQVSQPLVDSNGPLTRYVQFQVAHARGMPETFSPPPRVNDPDMHHGTCVTSVPRCMLGSLTGGFLWSWCRGKRSRHMRNPQFYVSGKRPMIALTFPTL